MFGFLMELRIMNKLNEILVVIKNASGLFLWKIKTIQMFVHLNDFFHNNCSNYISSTSYIIELEQEFLWTLNSRFPINN
jgi:hypothetical protein